MPTLPRPANSAAALGGPVATAQTTLSAAAGAQASPPTRRIWLGASAVVAVAGIAIALVLGRGPAEVASSLPPVPPPPAIDAAQVVAIAADAAIDTPPPPPPLPPSPLAEQGPEIPPGVSVAEAAEKLNGEGKDLMYSTQYTAASKKFRAALALVPEPKYFFNLCVSLTNEGRIKQALDSCESVLTMSNASSAMKEKTNKMVALIRKVAKEQNVDLSR
jgi:hypothetical protein